MLKYKREKEPDMTNLILVLLLAGILALAIGYIIRSKRRGARCIGCPDSGSCGSCSGQCSCGN